MHKAMGGVGNRMVRVAVFAVFCSKLSAIEISFSQKSRAADGSANEKTPKPSCPPLFFHCEGGNFTALFDEICMAAMIPQG
jgi:hypothetical protein